MTLQGDQLRWSRSAGDDPAEMKRIWLESIAVDWLSESIAVILIAGVVAGWTAWKFIQRRGFGLLGDLEIGIVGACIGYWLMPELNIHLGHGIVGWMVHATVGAGVLLLAISLIRGRSRSRLWAS